MQNHQTYHRLHKRGSYHKSRMKLTSWYLPSWQRMRRFWSASHLSTPVHDSQVVPDQAGHFSRVLADIIPLLPTSEPKSSLKCMSTICISHSRAAIWSDLELPYYIFPVCVVEIGIIGGPHLSVHCSITIDSVDCINAILGILRVNRPLQCQYAEN